MAFPISADFASPEPFGAWWTYTRAADRVDVCASSGAGVVAAVRRALGLGGALAWDAALLAGLRDRAATLRRQQGPAWEPLVNQLVADASAGRTSIAGMTFGLWLAYYAASGLRLDAIAIPSGTTSPGGQLLGGDPSAALVCWDRVGDAEPVLLTAAQLRAARDATQGGLRLRPGETLPGITPPPPPGEGLSGMQIALVALGGLAVIGALAMATDDKPRRAGR